MNRKLVVMNPIALSFARAIAQFLYFTHLVQLHSRSHQAARLLSLLSYPQNHASAGSCFQPLFRNSFPSRHRKIAPLQRY
ncbi:hypothetical protein [Microcoleus sp. bin38.metabat.b11b12b14.051]|uniref:hypothetical protein n=1 Tax=Microcoleus sp. bin38.metabat.b11b12b14.051 TaxID=2742709 RepID=UPI0025E52D78|nr:hypothetical protein [Microcoleus sp. bin38.metabat.b11b12b14.051]